MPLEVSLIPIKSLRPIHLPSSATYSAAQHSSAVYIRKACNSQEQADNKEIVKYAYRLRMHST
jgi:hypothetical protein